MSGARNCPLCGKPSDTRHAPFCSDRCKQIDLGRWLSGSYAIPAVEEDPEDPEDAEENEKPQDT